MKNEDLNEERLYTDYELIVDSINNSKNGIAVIQVDVLVEVVDLLNALKQLSDEIMRVKNEI